MSASSTAVSAGRPTQESGIGAQPFRPLRALLALLGMVVIVWFVANIFLAFGYYPQWFFNKVVIGIVALAVGVGGAVGLFTCLNAFVEALPEKISTRVIPYAFVLPALLLVGLVLVYPTLQTINYSFANSDSTAYVGLANYVTIFGDPEFWNSIINNVLWLIVVPAVTVGIGVVVAVLADKLSATGEKVVKSLIFLPMAISFVGASAIWGLVYAFRAADTAQVGLLNAIVNGLGGAPQLWLSISTLKLNSFLLMVILIWLQVGFSMVLLSSAIKGVPEDTLEAARIDGATELQIFFQVVIPQIWSTIVTVFVTVFIVVLKVFDIVYVTTNGSYNTNVIANLFFNKLFAASEAGQATAIVVVLLIAVIPLIVFQIRTFKEAESR